MSAPARNPQPWRRWTDEEKAVLIAGAGKRTAESIAAEIGRTASQVHKAAERLKLSMKPSPQLYAEIGKRRGASLKKAWRDPVKRARMKGGKTALSGAAVAGSPRRHGGGRCGPRPIPAAVMRWAGWFLVAGWSERETAALFNISAGRLTAARTGCAS